MSTVLSLTLPFFGLIFLGFMAAKFFNKEQSASDWLTIFVVYFTVPALLFSLLSKAPIEELGNMTFIVAATGSTLLVFILAFLLTKALYNTGIAATSLRAAAGSYSNCGYLGVPLAVAAFGSSAAIPATLIVCFDSLLIFVLVPVFIALGRSDRPGVWQCFERYSQPHHFQSADPWLRCWYPCRLFRIYCRQARSIAS